MIPNLDVAPNEGQFDVPALSSRPVPGFAALWHGCVKQGVIALQLLILEHYESSPPPAVSDG